MKALSLFSGIGGIDLAGEWAGIETVAFCESEPFCQKVLQKHWPDVPVYDDVRTLTKERLDTDEVGPIELIHGGYPCQPFSFAGNREGTEDDRHLWPEVFRLIQDLQPRWFVGENVAGHITLGLDLVLSDLEGIGYSWETFVIPASSVYARHRRERVFIVANPKGERCGETWKYQSLRAREWTPGGGETTSYPTGKGLSQWGRSERAKGESKEEAGLEPQFERCGENAAYTNGITGLETDSSTCPIGSEWESRDDVSWGSRGYIPGADWWATEPNVGRVANGVPDRVDRLKALGNAVVPQQIYPILAAIKQIDDMLKGDVI